MKSINLSFKELINGNTNLTFLVGAGCSVDPPSCQPAGKKMMDAMIRYSCAESEIEKLLEISDLRFEQLVEIIRDQLDKDLEIIDYYGECKYPNLQHFFLADIIKKGHFVITTNFDFLIEYALLQSGIPEKDIIPVITKSDYKKYQNPSKLIKKDKKPLYKVHGSTKNIIENKDTRDTLVATIQAFGSNKEGLNVFQVEPFKQSLFDNISNGRSLIILGYSGSDDFDIVPTLKVLTDLREIIWINFVFNDDGEEKIYEIDENLVNASIELDKVNNILVDIKRTSNIDHVYRVDTNTSRLVKSLISPFPELSETNFDLDPLDWFKLKLGTPDPATKYSISMNIYSDFNMYDDQLRCAKELLHLAEQSNDEFWKLKGNLSLSSVYNAQGEYSKALEILKSLEKKFKGSDATVEILIRIGQTYEAQSDLSGAQTYYELALRLIDKLKDIDKSFKAGALESLARVETTEGNYKHALEKSEEALKIFEQQGNLWRKASLLISIGELYKLQNNFSDALNRYETSLKIYELLGHSEGLINSYQKIGTIYRDEKNHSKALDYFKRALKLSQKIGFPSKTALSLVLLSNIDSESNNHSEALGKLKKALEIYENLNDLSGKAICIANIAKICYKQEKYSEALLEFQKALEIHESSLYETYTEAMLYWWIGETYSKIKDYSNAIENLKIAAVMYHRIKLKDMEQEINQKIKKLKAIIDDNS